VSQRNGFLGILVSRFSRGIIRTKDQQNAERRTPNVER
jgi:hypothetical protein